MYIYIYIARQLERNTMTTTIPNSLKTVQMTIGVCGQIRTQFELMCDNNQQQNVVAGMSMLSICADSLTDMPI